MRDRDLSTFTTNHVLSSMTEERILAKETRREYPLDRLNDMRALINYSTHYFDSCAAVWQELRPSLLDDTITSKARLTRLYMACLVSLGLKREQGRSTEFEEHFSREVGFSLLRRARLCVDGPTLPRARSTEPAVQHSAKKHHVLANGLARELADRLAMGEHPLYTFAVTVDEASETVTSQYFTNRTHSLFPYALGFRFYMRGAYWPTLTTVQLFSGRSATASTFDEILSAECYQDGKLLEEGEVNTLIMLLETTLSEVIAHQQSRTRTESREKLEVEKMGIYSTELFEASEGSSRWCLSSAAEDSILRSVETSRSGLSALDPHAPRFLELMHKGRDVLFSTSI